MTRRLIGLLSISLISSCTSKSTDSTDLTSLDSTKKYLNGVWCQNSEITTSEYQFIKDFRGLRINGTKQNDGSIMTESNPETFELLKKSDNVVIKLTSIAGQTIGTIEFLSKDKVIIDGIEYYKINYR
ncbi:hypothetical protein [Pedobacter sp. SYSU D00535]|uniref:hypothetical protein n=1 Tax=Pedobacter sp. SYSU D00535 TaxID=2810308 RepID=UPI001A974A01|nr:hypothetical protein [Pedobacter sp. SYSU D00535]